MHKGNQLICGKYGNEVQDHIEIVLQRTDKNKHTQLFVVKSRGKVKVNGSDERSKRPHLSKTANKGAKILYLQSRINEGWTHGDAMVIFSTDFNR